MQPTQAPAAAPRAGGARLVVGLALVLPAALALLVGYVLPSLQTVRGSFTRVGLPGTTGKNVGFDNYSALGAEAAQRFGYALAFIGIPLLAVLIVAPLLAFTAHLAGRRGRLAVRLALAVPMVCVAPVAIAAAWMLERGRGDSPGLTILAGVGLSTFGLVCGLAVIAYLAVLRRDGLATTSLLAGLAVAGIAVLATVAGALQVLAFPLMIGFAGPNGEGATPLFEVYTTGLRQFDIGGGMAISTLLGLPLGALGLAAALVVILTNLRLEPIAPEKPAPPARPWALPVTAGLLLVVLGVTLYGLWPWLRPLLGSVVPSGPNTGTLLVNTWVPALISTVLGVGLAALAGFAIGALRPLGRYSALLLLPFAPWLFAGIGPTALANFLDATEAETVNTFVGLIPPGWLSIPALFVFTVYFRGQAGRWNDLAASRGAGWALHGTWLPALPLLGLVGGATWLVRAQDIGWSFVVAYDEEHMTGPLWVVQGLARLDLDAVQQALPLPAVVLFAAALGAAQIWYLDRLSLRIGRE